jgi:hypothetical protein
MHCTIPRRVPPLPILKFDPDSVFEAATTRHMCAKLGVGVQFFAPYTHHMLGTPVVYTSGQRVCDASQYVRPSLNVVVRSQHSCLPPQPYVQPRGWSL